MDVFSVWMILHNTIWHEMIYVICHSTSIFHICNSIIFRWSIFITTRLLQLASTTFALLATTPKRRLILVWASSATLCNTGKSSPLLSDVSMNALQYRSETTNRFLKAGFGCISAKVPVVMGLFKKLLLTVSAKYQKLHRKVEMIQLCKIN